MQKHIVTRSLLCLLVFTSAWGNTQPLIQVPQNALTILASQPVRYQVSPAYEKTLRKDFLTHYYAPWLNRSFVHYANTTLSKEIKKISHTIKKYRSWGSNYKQNDEKWRRDIIHNMNVTQFPHHIKTAITLKQTQIRGLPTYQPSYNDPKKAGEGYPFDQLQVSMASANLPVLLLHQSRDGAWDYILINTLDTGPESGWVSSRDIAIVSPQFIKRWTQQNNQYIIINRDKIPVKNKNRQLLFFSRIGSILPLVHHGKTHDTVLVAHRGPHNQAVMSEERINNQYTKNWPLPLNSLTIAKEINLLIGHPYGWGGLYGERDCSETQKDLFANFGLWLPRHSTNQANRGQKVLINSKTPDQKKLTLQQAGMPFLTLINTSDHVLLYIGTWHHTPLVFHSPWGLHTVNPQTQKEGRIVIGKAVISPIDLGHALLNVPETWLSRANSFTTLIPKQYVIEKQVLPDRVKKGQN